MAPPPMPPPKGPRPPAGGSASYVLRYTVPNRPQFRLIFQDRKEENLTEREAFDKAHDLHQDGYRNVRIEHMRRSGLYGVKAKTASCVKIKAPLASFDRRSLRTLIRGSTRILIGCPKGQWMPRVKRCKVGTRAYETVTPGKCRRGSGGKTKKR